MKAKNFHAQMIVVVAAVLVLSASMLCAQNPATPNAMPLATASASVPPLSYGVPQILQLTQAKVGDDTIIAYIKNSGNSYGLDANQIIYLRQQGVSDAVVTTMLNQPRPGAAAATPAIPVPQPAAPPAPAPVTATTAAPSVTYVQSVPATTYYYYQPYYYPVYGGYPAVSLSFGWGGSYYYRGGYYGGYRGGYYGGWHGGGGHR